MQLQSLSLKTNSRMYLYNIPRDIMAKDPMFQNLCSTSIWNALGLIPNTSNSYNSCVPELMLKKNLITHVLQSLCSTQNLITHVLQYSGATHYRTQSYIQSSAHLIIKIISVYAFKVNHIIHPVNRTMKIIIYIGFNV